MTRQVDKQLLRKISEAAVLRVAGRVDRKLRRKAGRTYANAAYRDMSNLPPRGTAHPVIIKWVVDQYVKFGIEMPPMPTEEIEG